MASLRTQKLRSHLLDSTASLCIDRILLYTESLKETEEEPRVIRQAKALAHMLEGMPVQIFPDELIVGVSSDKP